jgi:hypothetical protein
MVLGGILGLTRAPSGPKFMNSTDLPEFVLQFCPLGDRWLSLIFARAWLPLAERNSILLVYYMRVIITLPVRPARLLSAPWFASAGRYTALTAAQLKCGRERFPSPFAPTNPHESEWRTSSLGRTGWPDRIRCSRSSWLSVLSNSRLKCAS